MYFLQIFVKHSCAAVKDIPLREEIRIDFDKMKASHHETEVHSSILGSVKQTGSSVSASVIQIRLLVRIEIYQQKLYLGVRIQSWVVKLRKK